MNGDLTRQLTWVAEDLDSKRYPYAGVVRQAARERLEVEQFPSDDADRCRGCGEELEYAGRGRPRVWCSEECRRSQYRTRR
jgi:hypothetical protein